MILHGAAARKLNACTLSRTLDRGECEQSVPLRNHGYRNHFLINQVPHLAANAAGHKMMLISESSELCDHWQAQLQHVPMGAGGKDT